MITTKRIIAAALILTCVYWLPNTAGAESAKELYFQAEACSHKLFKSKKKQKYRSNWLTCIEKSQAVYRQEPQGPWAAAGLFMTGSLYRDLYKRSGKPDDNREAIDHFERILKGFPQSAYAERARNALRTTSQASNTKKAPKKRSKPSRSVKNSASVSDQYHRAEACYRKLLDNPKQQKYRDRWLPCINKFETAYRTDPSDPWASASLYMAGFMY